MSVLDDENMIFDKEGLFRSTDLLFLKRNLSQYMITLLSKHKVDLLDEIELRRIPEFKARIAELKRNTDNDEISQMYRNHLSALKEKVKFLKKFVEKERPEIYRQYLPKKTKLNIIEALNFDTSFALRLANEQIAQDDYKKYLISSNRDLLDQEALKEYLLTIETNTPYLQVMFKSILTNALRIIELDNNVLSEIETRTHEKQLHNVIVFNEGNFISLSNNYECITINEKKVSNVNLSSERNRDYFRAHHQYTVFENRTFAIKSSNLIDVICAHLGINTEKELLKHVDFKPQFEEEKLSVSDELIVDVIHRSDRPEQFEKSDFETKIFDVIDDHLPREYFSNDNSHLILKKSLCVYFESGKFPPTVEVMLTVRMNKKKIGWGLSSIYREIKPSKSLTLEYVLFARNIDKFKDEVVDKDKFQKSNLYKYMTEKPRV